MDAIFRKKKVNLYKSLQTADLSEMYRHFFAKVCQLKNSAICPHFLFDKNHLRTSAKHANDFRIMEMRLDSCVVLENDET